MWPVISFAGLTIFSGLLAAAGALLVGNELAARALTRLALPEKQAEWRQALDQAFWAAVVVGLAGARFAFALRFPWLYLDAPSLLFSPRPGALAVGPGLIVAIGVFLFWLWHRHVPLAVVADAAAVGAAGAWALLSLGRFATGAGYGMPTDLPWGVELGGAARHPVQLYEAGAALLATVLLWRRLAVAQPGELFWRFLLYAGLAELVLAAFRANAATWLLGIRISQMVALAVLLLALYVLSFFAQAAAASGESGADMRGDMDAPNAYAAGDSLGATRP